MCIFGFPWSSDVTSIAKYELITKINQQLKWILLINFNVNENNIIEFNNEINKLTTWVQQLMYICV